MLVMCFICLNRLFVVLLHLMGPRGAHCTASTSTAGRLRDGSSGQIGCDYGLPFRSHNVLFTHKILHVFPRLLVRFSTRSRVPLGKREAFFFFAEVFLCYIHCLNSTFVFLLIANYYYCGHFVVRH